MSPLGIDSVEELVQAAADSLFGHTEAEERAAGS